MVTPYSRVDFNSDDDKELLNYIAKSIPDEKAGGRLGLNFYKHLVEMVIPTALSYIGSIQSPDFAM